MINNNLRNQILQDLLLWKIKTKETLPGKAEVDQVKRQLSSEFRRKMKGMNVLDQESSRQLYLIRFAIVLAWFVDLLGHLPQYSLYFKYSNSLMPF